MFQMPISASVFDETNCYSAKKCICDTFLPNALLYKFPINSDSFLLVTSFSNWTDNCHNDVLLSNRIKYSPIKT